MSSSCTSIFQKLPVAALTLILAVGCVERLPIEPVVTDDEDWTPSFSVLWTGYGRVDISVEGPPRKELLRNIRFYELLKVRSDNPIVEPFDTIAPARFTPSYVGRPMSLNRYRSKPGLDYYSSYELLLRVHYYSGGLRESASRFTTTGSGKGKILYRLQRVAENPEYYYSDFNRKLTTWNTKVLYSAAEHVYAVDTVSGAGAYLLSLLPTPSDWNYDRFEYRLRTLGVDGDTLNAVMEVSSERRITVRKFNLITFALDTSVSYSIDNGWWVEGASAAGEKCAILEQSSENLRRVSVISLRTGDILQRYTPGVMSNYAYERFCFDGTDFWVSWEYYHDDAESNVIRKLDPLTLAYTVVHRIPVYHYDGISVDNGGAWVVDQEDYAIVRVGLEGH